MTRNWHLRLACCGLALFLIGSAGISAEVPTYRLPFPEGAAYSVLQSFDGRHGHTDAARFSVDFKMPTGTPIGAARSGVVVKVVEDHANAAPRQPEPGKENYIVIDHGDGTFGRYYHLDKAGSDVATGDAVERGQPIGRSGNSGASFGPHLHFDVTESCYEWGCQTVRFRFAMAKDDPLVEGETYSNDPRPAASLPLADLALESPLGLAVVEARVNGAKLTLLVDTGFDVTVIDAGVAERLGLKGEEATLVPQPGGAVATGVLPPIELALGGARFDIDSAQAMPLAGLFGSMGLPGDGILGHDVLSQAIFDFDYPAGRFRIWRSVPASLAEAQAIPVEIVNSEAFVEASLLVAGREPIVGRFKLDTGSTDVAGLNRNFGTANGILGLPGSRSLRGIAAGGATEGEILRIRGFDLAGLTVERPVIGITTDSAGFEDRADAGTIGGGVLTRFRLVLDYPADRILLLPGPGATMPGPVNKAGLMALAMPPAFDQIVVFQVIDGSPAAEAGLRSGDLLLSVDGSPATASALIPLWERLHQQKAGTPVEVQLERDGKAFGASFMLRDDWLPEVAPQQE